MRIYYRKDPAALFWSHVEKTDTCWLWTGVRTKQGYGVFGQHHRVHRFSWELHFGPIPEGMWVLHRCDNPPCVNPAHLFLGDRLDNIMDMVAKGRSRRGHENILGSQPGERNGRAKITSDDVIEIRRLYATGGWTFASLGREFGLTHGPVRDMVRRKNWKHVI